MVFWLPKIRIDSEQYDKDIKYMVIFTYSSASFGRFGFNLWAWVGLFWSLVLPQRLTP